MKALSIARSGILLWLLAVSPSALRAEVEISSSPSPQGGPRALVIRVGRIIPVSGPETGPGAVVIEKGRIAALGSQVILPAAAKVLDFPKAVLFPGFIDAGCQLGLGQKNTETAAAFVPDYRVSDAFDAEGSGLLGAVKSGITSLHLIPGDADPVSGFCGVVKADGSGRARWLRRRSGLHLSFAEELYLRGRQPTSALGCLDWLEASDHPQIRRFKSGAVRGFITALKSGHVSLAARVSAQKAWDTVLLTGTGVRDLGPLLKKKVKGVILRCIQPSARLFDRRIPAALSRAGVSFAFMTQAPSHPSKLLRLSAVVARQAGLSKEAAHRALSLDAARLLGVADRVGSIEKGKDADLLVLSHDPTDPRARLLLVVQDGRIVYRAKRLAEGVK